MLDAVEGFVTHIRAVARSDQEYLEGSDRQFNLHALIGSKLEKNFEPHIYLVYPEGKWIEIGERTP